MKTKTTLTLYMYCDVFSYIVNSLFKLYEILAWIIRSGGFDAKKKKKITDRLLASCHGFTVAHVCSCKTISVEVKR